MEAGVAVRLGKGVGSTVRWTLVNRCSSQLHVHDSAYRGRAGATVQALEGTKALEKLKAWPSPSSFFQTQRTLAVV